MQVLIDLTTAIRNLRIQWNISPHEPIECYLSSSSKSEMTLLKDSADIIKNFGRLKNLILDADALPKKNSATTIVGTVKCTIPLTELIDVEKEKGRLLKETQMQKTLIDNLSQRLQNKDFLNKAPEDVIKKEKERLNALQLKHTELQIAIQSLDS